MQHSRSPLLDKVQLFTAFSKGSFPLTSLLAKRQMVVSTCFFAPIEWVRDLWLTQSVPIFVCDISNGNFYGLCPHPLLAWKYTNLYEALQDTVYIWLPPRWKNYCLGWKIGVASKKWCLVGLISKVVSAVQCGMNILFLDKWISEYICYHRYWTNEYSNIFGMIARLQTNIRISLP